MKAYGDTIKLRIPLQALTGEETKIFMQSDHNNKSHPLSPTRLKPSQATNTWLEALIHIWNTSFLNWTPRCLAALSDNLYRMLLNNSLSHPVKQNATWRHIIHILAAFSSLLPISSFPTLTQKAVHSDGANSMPNPDTGAETAKNVKSRYVLFSACGFQLIISVRREGAMLKLRQTQLSM